MFQTLSDYITLKRHQKKSSLKDIQTYQLKSIKKLVDYAKIHSPFYQDTLKDLPLSTLEDFKAYPIINKAVMMANFTTLNTHQLVKDDVMAYALEKERNKDYLGYYQDTYVVGLSSGTSGNKGLYITPKSMTKRLPGVFLARSGLSIKDLPMRILFCLRVFSQGFNDINAPGIKLSYMSTMTPPEEIIARINEQKINILMAPPSLIRFLRPLHHHIKVKLKKIITYAEVLTKDDQSQIEKAFQTQVIEIYQASEGQIASACSKGKLHINEDLVYIELFDEHQQIITKPHIVGHRMILTNLINHAQPLIRYEMNDMIILDDPCPCGSHFRTIEKVLGRSDDLIYFFDSNHQKKVVFPDLMARWIMTESDDIREFQVIQERVGQIHLYIDATTSYQIEGLQARLEQELKALDLSADIKMTLKKLCLPKEENKFKRFISTLS